MRNPIALTASDLNNEADEKEQRRRLEVRLVIVSSFCLSECDYNFSAAAATAAARDHHQISWWYAKAAAKPQFTRIAASTMNNKPITDNVFVDVEIQRGGETIKRIRTLHWWHLSPSTLGRHWHWPVTMLQLRSLAPNWWQLHPANSF